MEQYEWKDKNILIIEDDQLTIKLFKEWFRKYSKSSVYIITNIFNLKQKINNFNSVDLVISDIKLPDGEIFPHLDEIKNSLNCEIILQSTFYLRENKKKFKNVYEWFNKPISRKELFNTIDNIFKNDIK